MSEHEEDCRRLREELRRRANHVHRELGLDADEGLRKMLMADAIDPVVKALDEKGCD